MADRPWGFWTESKLDMLSAYLRAFTTASKKAHATVYLDLFAGQEMNINKHTGLPIDGSLRRALQTNPPFTVLRGFELREDRAASLQAAYRRSAPGRDVTVFPHDVHTSLRPALAELSGYRWAPTFAFIDPDGVEARWELLETLAAHKHTGRTKVEIFLLLVSPQIGRVVNDSLDLQNRHRAERQISDLFGSDEWKPILAARRSGDLDPAAARDELTNLMRWRLEQALGYRYTHTLRLTNLQGTPLYDMVFATDHAVGDKIMNDVYRAAAARFPRMRQEARARRRDLDEVAHGSKGFWSYQELVDDDRLGPGSVYEHFPAVPPYPASQR